MLIELVLWLASQGPGSSTQANFYIKMSFCPQLSDADQPSLFTTNSMTIRCSFPLYAPNLSCCQQTWGYNILATYLVILNENHQLFPKYLLHNIKLYGMIYFTYSNCRISVLKGCSSYPPWASCLRWNVMVLAWLWSLNTVQCVWILQENMIQYYTYSYN